MIIPPGKAITETLLLKKYLGIELKLIISTK
jgi:hypothetical protein